MKNFSQATALLKRKLGARVVRTDAVSRNAASFDSSKIMFSAAAVICPRKEADIGVVLELANKYRVPVTTRGRPEDEPNNHPHSEQQEGAGFGPKRVEKCARCHFA